MTFCLGITVDEGLVAIADARVVAGNETLVARKTASYQGPGFAFFVINSGLRSLRDKILLCFEEAFARGAQGRDRLYKVVNLYAQQVRRVAEEDGAALERAGLKSTRTRWSAARWPAIRLIGCFWFTPKATGWRWGPTRRTRSSARRLRQADPRALADAIRLHAVRLQGGAAGF